MAIWYTPEGILTTHCGEEGMRYSIYRFHGATSPGGMAAQASSCQGMMRGATNGHLRGERARSDVCTDDSTRKRCEERPRSFPHIARYGAVPRDL